MQRREFLRLGSMSCASLAMAQALPARALLGEASLRIAHAEDWGGPVVDATGLAHGDPAMARDGVRLSVLGFEAPLAAAVAESCEARHGFDPPVTGPRWQGRAALDVAFPNPEAGPGESGASRPFHAWCYDAASGGESAQTCSFFVPVDAAGQLSLQATWNDQTFPVTLTAGTDRDRPKLRRGVYWISAGLAPPMIVTVDSAESEFGSVAPWRTRNV